MANYIISEDQLSSLMLFINEDKKGQLSSVEAMRKIVSVLRKNGFEDEDIVDFIINLRTSDDLTYLKAKRIKDDEDYYSSVDTLFKKHKTDS